MPLKTDYKNFIPSTTTKIFDIKQASDETVINADVILEDVTVYSQEGDAFGAADINATNTQVNANTDAVALKAPLSNVESGWLAISATLTYASADSPTFVANTSIDLTNRISVGMKLKLTQSTVKYFIVTAITSTTITLYGGTDYTLLDSAITDVYFSSVRAPFGFPLDKSKWTVRFEEGSTEFSQSSPTQNTWYNMYSISVPIGLWEIEWSGVIAAISTASQTGVRVQGTLSTTNNGETNNNLTAYQGVSGASGTIICLASVMRKDLISLSSKTTHYLNIRTVSASATVAAITNAAANQPTIIQAVCAYL